MRIARALLTLALFSGVALGAPEPADAQIWKKAKETVKQAAEDQALIELEERVRNAVTCTFDDIECINIAKSDDEDVILVDEQGELILDDEGQPISDPSYLPPEYQDRAGSSEAEEAVAVDPNYDFEPGSDVIFEDDYSADNLGDFPRRMEFVRGNWDVVDRGGMRLLRNTGPRHSAVKIPLPETLPETFTIEFPVLLYEGNANLALATSEPPPGRTQRVHHYEHNYFDIGSWGVGVVSRDDADPTATSQVREALTSDLVPVRIMADGQYVKVYVGEQRVANVPNADLERGDVLWIENTYAASEEKPILIGPIRVAAGGRDLYDVLEAKGRVTVDGIFFDTDQATIKPESAEVLAEVAAMLETHPDLSLLVEGHTDDQGGFEHNMTLSKERSDAVKAWLVERHGIDGERLRTMGLGPTQPVDDNGTDEGRAKNRRVELVRI